MCCRPEYGDCRSQSCVRQATTRRGSGTATGAPHWVRDSGDGRRSRKGWLLRAVDDSRYAERDRRRLGAYNEERWCGLRRLRLRRREMLTKRAIRWVDTRAVLCCSGLDVRECAGTRCFTLELRVGVRNRRRQHELEQGGNPPQYASEAVHSAHSVNVIGSERCTLPERER